ncbi:hypothetical protein ACFVYT_24690 [Streptomyces sp. NPDC058290]|uniref:hypothetical protein n=1 Tax=Streptomyces sp. NPDC058290 TaxID=3346426 RepID=UPI0036EB57DB
MSTDLLCSDDPEAFAFFADVRRSLAVDAEPVIEAAIQPVAPVPDLSNLTGMPDGPDPDDVICSSWSGASMATKLEAQRRWSANSFAHRAGECQATGRWMKDWHGSRHAAVLGLLASAEQSAPEADRPWHAARLDAYAAAYGLRGWYRTTGLRGKHEISINFIRTHADGDRGRYYRHAAYQPLHGPTNHWVVDRDTGRTVYRTVAGQIAQQWIEAAEAAA